MSEHRPPVWRAWLAEALGTALLVLGGLSGVALANAGVLPKLAAYSVAPGLTILALVYMLSDLSGAHLNPAVTLAFALRGSFPWARLPGYWAAQLLGALIGGGALAALIGVPKPGGQLPHAGTFWLEVACTALLTLVILAAAKRKAEVGTEAGIVVAGTLALCAFVGGSVSAVTLNTALALAWAVFGGAGGGAWPHVLGPLLGSVLAVGLTWALRGGLDGQEASAAQGEQAKQG